MIQETVLQNLHRLLIAIRDAGILESHPGIVSEYRRICNDLGYDPAKIARLKPGVSSTTHPEYQEAFFIHLNPEE